MINKNSMETQEAIYRSNQKVMLWQAIEEAGAKYGGVIGTAVMRYAQKRINAYKHIAYFYGIFLTIQ